MPSGMQLMCDCSAFITPDRMRRPDWWVWICAFGVIGIKLPAPQKLSCGPFGSDVFWLGSTAPGLQMWFEDCFHPLCETQGQIRHRLFSLGMQKAPPQHTSRKYRCTAKAHNFSVYLFPFILVPSVRWVCMHTHTLTHPWQKISKFYLLAQRQFPSKEKKMLRMIGLENL